MPHDSTTDRTCEHCGKRFTTTAFRRFFKVNAARFCSHACANAFKRGKPVRPLAERFWAKVRKTDTCWLWTAATDHNGYGRIG
ncbi:MAG TPA: hypothetical protein VFT99_16560, partial [Roseiflexaceae bacterium]|nr:hypothetical protein [Roseiflexaceae bacterium]